ncbi:MAG: DUF3592 domain-containing protein [Isosphaerales bacterium]
MRKPRKHDIRRDELAHLTGGWRAELVRMKRENSGCSVAFFGLFFLAGCGSLVMLVWGFLLLDWRANNRYLPNSCVVLDRRLAKEMSDPPPEGGRGGPVYHPEIKIRYEVGGRKYEVWTYDAIHMWYPNRAGQQAIVDSFQVGATCPCWYDPDRPDKAILVRRYTVAPYVLLVVPVGFLLIGGIGISITWKNRRKTAQERGLERALRAGGGALSAGPDRSTVPALDLSQSPGTTLPYRLPTSTRPVRNVLGCLFFTLVWNGIAAPFIVNMIGSRLGASWAKPGPPWPIELLIILFALAGVSVAVFFIYFCIAELLVAIGVGPTTVEISHHPLEPGVHFEVFLAQGARRTMKMISLRVVCVCEEEATRSGGESARTETRRVYAEEILARDRFELRPTLPLEARAELRLPRGAMHSFLAVHNQVRWKLVVRGDVAGWPNFEREFPIVVQPSKGTPK